MTAIRFCGLGTLPILLSEWQPDAVVTMLAPTGPKLDIHGPKRLDLRFHDVNQGWIKPRRTPMTALQMERFIDFVRSGHKRLVVHCARGMSRSPAGAIIARIALGEGVESAVDSVLGDQPAAVPNRRVIGLGAATSLAGALTRRLA